MSSPHAYQDLKEQDLKEQAIDGGSTRLDNELQFTGERFLPEVEGQIAFEHLHRYYFARRFCKGLRTLDIACGEGYGSHILSDVSSIVVGVDIDGESVRHATSRYGGKGLRFVEASADVLPFADDSFDVVVSFETIEHHDRHNEMMSELARVLAPDGILIMSSPNKQYYSVETGFRNPYHVKELFRDEFVALTQKHFRHVRVLGQRVVHGSLIVVDQEPSEFESQSLAAEGFTSVSGLGKPLYDLLVASHIKEPELENSLFESEIHGMDAARFYGVHLPERISLADNTISMLRAELAGQPLAATLSEDRFAALSALGQEIRASLNLNMEGLTTEVSKQSQALARSDAQFAALSSLGQEIHKNLDVNLQGFAREVAKQTVVLSESETSLSKLSALGHDFQQCLDTNLRGVTKEVAKQGDVMLQFESRFAALSSSSQQIYEALDVSVQGVAKEVGNLGINLSEGLDVRGQEVERIIRLGEVQGRLLESLVSASGDRKAWQLEMRDSMDRLTALADAERIRADSLGERLEQAMRSLGDAGEQREVIEARVAAHQNELETLTAKLEASILAELKVSAELDRQVSVSNTVRERIEEMELQHDVTRHELSERDFELGEIRRELETANWEFDRMKNSRSWKATGWLRRLSRTLRGEG